MPRPTFLLLACFALPLASCVTNSYSSDPNRRMKELINESEDLREIEKELERFWMNGQPSHFTPERVHGGLGDKVPRTLTVANVRKEEVTLFAVRDGSLAFLRKLPAGEAADLENPPGDRLAVTFAGAPHCENYTVKGTDGEVWLLRPTSGPR